MGLGSGAVGFRLFRIKFKSKFYLPTTSDLKSKKNIYTFPFNIFYYKIYLSFSFL